MLAMVVGIVVLRPLAAARADAPAERRHVFGAVGGEQARAVEPVNFFVYHGSRDLVAETRRVLIVAGGMIAPRRVALLSLSAGRSGAGGVGLKCCCCSRGAARFVCSGGGAALRPLRTVIRVAVVVDAVLDSAVTLRLVAAIVTVVLVVLGLVSGKDFPRDTTQRVVPVRLGYQLVHCLAFQILRRFHLWVEIVSAVAVVGATSVSAVALASG